MTYRTAARLVAASLVFASFGVFGTACSDDTTTTNTADIQKSRQVDDNATYSALVEQNFMQAQVNTQAQALLTDPDAIALSQTLVSHANANLTTLYGSPDVNGTDGTAATEGGLGASAGLTLGTNALTSDINNTAQADITDIAGAPNPDLELAKDEVIRLSALRQSFGDLVGNDDGGVSITNENLRTEIQNEINGWNADLTQALTVCTNLNVDGSASDVGCGMPPAADGGGDAGE